MGVFLRSIQFRQRHKGTKGTIGMHAFGYILTNNDFTLNSFDEYLIYDEIGLIGSVGGTLGLILEYKYNAELTFLVLLIFENILLFFRYVHWLFFDWCHILVFSIPQKTMSKSIG